MKSRFSNRFIAPLLLILIAIFPPLMPDSALSKDEAVILGIAGDSTVCTFPEDGALRGWGQMIGEHFQPGSVKVANLAKSGRSTSTFRSVGLWDQLLAAKPNYILIQFGHNDSHGPDRPESTDPATSYSENLRRYVEESRKAGAIPILVTPMVRRTFRSDGKLKDVLQVYADAMIAVGKETDTPVIDLHASSKKLVESLGPKESAKMANKDGDLTHFNAEGARQMAELVIEGLPQANADLAKLLRKP